MNQGFGNFGDNFQGFRESVRVELNANQSINNDTQTFLSWDFTPFDPSGMWNPNIKTDIRIRVPGLYFISFQGQFDSGSVGVRQAQIIRMPDIFAIGQWRFDAAASPSAMIWLTATIARFKTDEFLRFRVYQTQGTSLLVLGAPPTFTGRTAAIVQRLAD